MREPGTVAELISFLCISTEWEKVSSNAKTLWRLAFKTPEGNLGIYLAIGIAGRVAYALEEKR